MRARIPPEPPPAARQGPVSFQDVAEQFVDPLFFARAGVLDWVSPAIRGALGWSPGELESTRLADLAEAVDAGRLEELVGRAQAGGTGRGVFRLRSADGGSLWVLVTLTGDSGAAGTGVIGSLREVDRRIRAERHLELIAKHTLDVVLVCGPDGCVDWVSSNVERAWGWVPADLLGRRPEDLADDAGRPLVRALFAAATRGSDTGVPGWRAEEALSSVRQLPIMSPAAVEVRLLDRVGTPRWARVSAGASDPDLDLDGAVIGVLRDVDSLVRARESARRDAERVRAVLDGMQDPHCLLEPVRVDGRIVDFSVAAVNDLGCSALGRRREDLVGRSLLDLLPGVGTSGLFGLFAEAMSTGEPVVVEDMDYPGFELTGDDRHFDVRAVRVEDQISLVWHDITERLQRVDALAASEENYRLLAENTADIVLRHRDGLVLWASPSIREGLGWEPSELVGTQVAALVHPADATRLSPHDDAQRTSPVIERVRLRAADGRYHWVDVNAHPYVIPGGVVDGAVASLRIVDEAVAVEEDLDHRARHDELTGLLNRSEVLAAIRTAPDHRHPGTDTAVLFCDLDRFKDVNDTFGHAVGDEVLRVTARRVRASIRRDDLAARVGGDELLVVLYRLPGLAAALAVAENVRAAAHAPIPLADGRTVTTSLSIGVTTARPDESIDDLVERADAAMYEAKARGRDRVLSLD